MLHGISSSFDADLSRGFLVLEYLQEETLIDRMKRWTAIQGLERRRIRRNDEVLRRTTEIGVPLAEALAFLHENGIMHRDVKPHNVGFDARNQVKLFDFGLARKFRTNDDTDENRKMTKMTGSLRYMAPEIMRGEPTYGAPADAYSFSVLLWEVCTLKRAYDGIPGARKAERSIAYRHKRPPLGPVREPTGAVRQLLREGWHRDPCRRPTMGEILRRLGALRHHAVFD